MPRDDILVSICIHDVAPSAEGVEVLGALARTMSDGFRYWEILAAVPADASSQWIASFRSVPNLRLLRLRQGLTPYERRAVLAAEAIGDVILLTAAGEIGFVDARQMITDAHQKNVVVIGDRGRASLMDTMLGFAGNGSGFRVNARFMQTIAVPKGLLTRLLSQPERQLALRFPPRDSSIPIRLHRAAAFPVGARRTGLGGRLYLSHRLIVSSAPNALLALSVASFLTAVSGFLFLLYVVAVWTLYSAVQPGWATTAGILGLSATFLGLVGLGLSTGIQKVIDLVGHRESDDVLEEIGQINIYAGISKDLNVHYDRGGAPAALPAARVDADDRP